MVANLDCFRENGWEESPWSWSQVSFWQHHTKLHYCVVITLIDFVCVRSIFDDVGDYIVSTSSSSSKPSKDKERHRERDRDDDSKSRRHSHSYFEKPRGDEHQVNLHTHKTHKGGLFLRGFWTCFCVSVCLQAIEVDPGKWPVNTIQTKARIRYVPLSHQVPVCLSCHVGPVSVREQIKMINEKFAGAAGNQWQEPYPLHRYTLLQTLQQQLTSCHHIIAVLL